MVAKAFDVLSTENNNAVDGIPAEDIKTYILDNYPTVRADLVHFMVRSALKDALHQCAVRKPRVSFLNY